jgi:hypothetical protein
MKGAVMRRRAAGTAVAVFVAVASAGVAVAEDDLDVVRRAVAANQSSAVSSPAPEATPAPKGKPPRWLKVRVVDKSSRKARVSVNLPLGLVRVFGSDLPVDWHCRSRQGDAHGHECSVRIGDVLRTLESGQGIVEIDDPEATVRVWVE